MNRAFTYIKENNGIDTETSYPYLAHSQVCQFNTSNVGATDTGYVEILSQDEKALEQAVATIGPISVAVDASPASFVGYKSGGKFILLNTFN
jgi:cathepsin L